MEILVVQAIYIFFEILEILLFLYIICSWFPFLNSFKKTLTFFLDPLFDPIRYLLKHSIMKSNVIDISPMIAFIIITYLKSFFS